MVEREEVKDERMEVGGSEEVINLNIVDLCSRQSHLVCVLPVVIDCGDPGIPANGQRSVTDSSFFSSEVSYTCNAGFVLIGPTTRVCNESGWSGFLPFCERVDCGDPGVIRNGDRALGSTTYLSRVVYFCVPGYVLDGNSNRVCEANGNWSGSLPTCISKSSMNIMAFPLCRRLPL